MGVYTIWPHSRRSILTRKEGNVLFNDEFNTFYLRLYGVTHMVKDHSDSERRNPLPQHGLLFPISSNGSFTCIIPQTGYTHTTVFVTPVVEHWLGREIAQCVHVLLKDRSDDPSCHERTLLLRKTLTRHIAPGFTRQTTLYSALHGIVCILPLTAFSTAQLFSSALLGSCLAHGVYPDPSLLGPPVHPHCSVSSE